jgi:hypothetical protein
MKPLLDAIHALQTVPFTINIPVLLFLRRMEQPPLPPPDKSKLTPGQFGIELVFCLPASNLLRSKMKCCGALIPPCFSLAQQNEMLRRTHTALL